MFIVSLSQLLSKELSHPAVFTSNVQCVHLAAERRPQSGDATDRAIGQWHHRLQCVVQQQGGGGHIEHLI